MKRQKLVDSVLEAVRERIENEVGGLMGCKLDLLKPVFRACQKDDCFPDLARKSVLARLSISGDQEGEGYLVFSLKDAIRLGGTLIMLPDAELEERLLKEEFSEEEQDAFGEIANIIAGSCVAVFEETFPEKLHFVRKELEVVVPSKIDMDSDLPFPPGWYYVSSADLRLEGQGSDSCQIILPCGILGIEPPAESAEQGAAGKRGAEATGAQPSTKGPGGEAAGWGSGAPAGPEGERAAAGAAGTGRPESYLAEGEGAGREVAEGEIAGARPAVRSGPPTVLVVADDPDLGGEFVALLEEQGFTVQQLGFKDNIKETLASRNIIGGFIVMGEVNDQGIAAIIKVKSACGGAGPLPLVAAGPAWTKRSVLQAVKYGVRDIVLTPANDEEIREKIMVHLKEHLPPAA